MQVDAARKLVERLLKPLDEEMNEHKRIQVTTQASLPACTCLTTLQEGRDA